MPFERDNSIPAVRHHLKGVVTYEVTADDFDRIKVEASSVGTDLQFATACLPVAFTLTITLLTVAVPSNRVFETFLVTMVVLYVVGIYCGVRAWKQRGRFDALVNNVVAQQVGPVGEQGRELLSWNLSPLNPHRCVSRIARSHSKLKWLQLRRRSKSMKANSNDFNSDLRSQDAKGLSRVLRSGKSAGQMVALHGLNVALGDG